MKVGARNATSFASAPLDIEAARAASGATTAPRVTGGAVVLSSGGSGTARLQFDAGWPGKGLNSSCSLHFGRLDLHVVGMLQPSTIAGQPHLNPRPTSACFFPELERQVLNASTPDTAVERLVISLPHTDVSSLATAGTAMLPPGEPYELAASITSLLSQAEQLSADAVDSSCQRVAEAVFNHFARETGRSTTSSAYFKAT